MFYAYDVNILGMKAHVIWRKNLASLLLTRKLIGLVVNAEKIHYMFVAGKQNTGQNHDIQIDYKSLKVRRSSKVWKQL